MSEREPISKKELEWVLDAFAPEGTIGKVVRELLTTREELAALRANLKTVTDREKNRVIRRERPDYSLDGEL